MMRTFLIYFVLLLGALSVALARPIQDTAARATEDSDDSDIPRLVVYFQTTHDASGNPISMLPPVQEKGIALTHLIVCSFHINQDSDIHLNDYPPGDAHFNTLWSEADVLRDAGVRVMGMIGGAAAGSFNTQTLDGDSGTFDHYYGQLRDVIQTYSLQGMDLDVEQYMSQSGITRLVDSLHADFGPDFLITLAPVASALSEGANLSGFDYVSLEAAAGSNISFYNAQFYNGFGSMATTDSYDEVIADGWAPRKIVAGQVTAPANGYEYVPFPELNETVIELRDKYGQIGGIMGWEYFNSEPGGTAEPWQWAQEMTAILRPDGVPALTITTEKAVQLEQAWRSSVISSQAQGAYAGDSPQAKPNVDYMAMVSA